MRRLMTGTLLALALGVPGHAAVQGEVVRYKAGDVVMQGYLAYDSTVTGKRPAVLVVHQWWGQIEHERSRARKLAAAGYTALAVDMYGDGKYTEDPNEAGQLMGAVRKDLPLLKERFQAAMAFLRNHPTVDATRFAAVGYSFGGAVVLEMARLGVDLKGVACFYGNPGTDRPAKRGEVKAKVLVLNGAADTFVREAQIAAFKKEMEAAAVDYKFVNYEGVKHAFDNPEADARGAKFNLPLQYNAKADRESWAELMAFLDRVMK